MGLPDCPVLRFDFETDEGLSFRHGSGGSYPPEDRFAIGVSRGRNNLSSASLCVQD